MKIGIDASRANLKIKTGTEWYAYFIIKELKKITKPSDQIILYSKNPLKGKLAILPDNFSSRVLNWPFGFLWTQLRLAWEMLLRPPDALFVPAHTIPIISPKLTYTTLHDVGFEAYQHLYSKKKIGSKNRLVAFLIGILVKIITFGKYSNTELDYHRWSTRLALKKAKKIITVSRFSKQEIVKYFPAEKNKILVIPNGYNKKYRQITDKNAIAKILKKYSIKTPYFLFTGRLEEKKNTGLLIEAYNKFLKSTQKVCYLVLVGQPGYGYKKIEKKITNYKLEKWIIRLGWINDEDLVYITNGASAFIFPSNYEGFGIPILEAFASGTPVITSNFGSMKEISENAAILVNQKDYSEIAEAMEKIFKEPDNIQKNINNGLKIVEKYSWHKTTQQILKLLKTG